MTYTTRIFINTLTTMLIDLSFKEPNLSVALRQTTSVHSLCSLWAKEQDLSTVKHFQHFFSRMVGTSNKFQFCGAVVVVVSMCFIQPALLKKKICYDLVGSSGIFPRDKKLSSINVRSLVCSDKDLLLLGDHFTIKANNCPN
jgi:hypothetical protein